MVNVSDMTPEEAKKYLEKQQKKSRERQKAYVNKQLKEGKRRVNTYIMPEAGKFLDDEMDRTGKGASDILSEALMLMKRSRAVTPAVILGENKTERHAVTKTAIVTEHHATNPDYDKDKTEAYIMKLYEQGLSLSGIAKQLNEEGWPTHKVGSRWFHKVVGNIVNRLKIV